MTQTVTFFASLQRASNNARQSLATLYNYVAGWVSEVGTQRYAER